MAHWRVVLVRHGESEWNAQRRWQGHGGGGLTAKGHAQASVTAAYLLRTEPDVVRVVHSDLQRVVETAAPVVQALDTKVDVTQTWREIDVGWWSGLTHDEIATRDPDAYAAVRRGEDVRRGGGETAAGFRSRVASALAALRHGEPGTVLVFTHGGCVRAAAAEALGVPVGAPVPLGGAGNCSVTVLEAEQDQSWVLRSYNGAGHLTVAD